MKKLLIIIIVLMSISGCAEASDSGIPLEGISPQEIAAIILEAAEIPSAVQKTAEDLPDFIPGLDTAGIEEAAYYICASGAYPDELLIIKFRENEQASNALISAGERLETRKSDFKDYRPDEMYKFDDSAVTVKGKWLFLYITEDNIKVKEIIDSYD